jgi:hypothetical protein
LPKLVVPTTTARSWSCSAPATISLADAGAAVDHHDERDVRRHRLLGGHVHLRLALPPALAQHVLPALEEHVARRHRLLEDAARVAAQVEDHALGPLGLERLDRLRDLLGRALAEPLRHHVAHRVVEDERVRHRGDVDHRARQVRLDGRRDAGALERHRHARARRADERVRHLLRAPAARRLRVDLHDAVALLHPGALGGRVGEHARHAHEAALRRRRRLDLHPMPA